MLKFNQIVLEDPTPLSPGRDLDVLSPGTWRGERSGDQAGSDPRRPWLGQVGALGGRGRPGRRTAWCKSQPRGWANAASACPRPYLAHCTDDPLGPAARALHHALLQRAAGAALADCSCFDPPLAR